MTNDPKEDLATAIGKAIGELLAFVFILNVQAWLVAYCTSLFFPAFFLPFWQWLIVVFTIRFLFFK